MKYSLVLPYHCYSCKLLSIYWYTLIATDCILHVHTCIIPLQGVLNVAAVSLQIGYPTVASVPHSIVNGFKVTHPQM